jgi:hypothetical protein
LIFEKTGDHEKAYMSAVVALKCFESIRDANAVKVQNVLNSWDNQNTKKTPREWR